MKMKQVWQWIKVLRPLNGLFLAVPATILGFWLINHQWREGVPYAVAVFIIYSTIILWNDWRDRHADKKKGKTFVLQNFYNFQLYLGAWICAAIIAIGWLWWQKGSHAAVLALLLLFLGSYYSIERFKNPFSKNVIVAFCASLLLFFSAQQGFIVNHAIWRLAVIVFLLTYGREVLKDIEDRYVDWGHKQTIVLRYGERVAKRFAFFSLFFATLIAIFTLNCWSWGVLVITGGIMIFLVGAVPLSSLVRILKFGTIVFIGSVFIWG